MGHAIIMGRCTFESFPNGALPGRRNIVVTRQADWQAPGAERVGSPAEALAACEGAERVYVVGGGEIYRQFLPLATTLELTEIDAAPADADTFFPSVDFAAWTLAEASSWQGEAPRFRFVTLRRE